MCDCYQKLLTAEGATASDSCGGTLTSIRDILIFDPEDAYLGWLLTALTPWANIPASFSSEGKLSPPPAAVVAREGIKATSKVCKIITDGVRNAGEIATIKDAVIHQAGKKSINKSQEDDITTRDALGMSVRRWGTQWRSHALLSLLLEVEQSDGSTEGKVTCCSIRGSF